MLVQDFSIQVGWGRFKAVAGLQPSNRARSSRQFPCMPCLGLRGSNQGRLLTACWPHSLPDAFAACPHAGCLQQAKMRHAVGADTGAMFCVYSNGRMKDGNLEMHR